MAKTVVGLFDQLSEAQSALQQLQSAGFSRDNASLIANNSESRYGNQWGQDAGGDQAFEGGDYGTANETNAAPLAVAGGPGAIISGFGQRNLNGIGPVIAGGPLFQSSRNDNSDDEGGIVDSLQSAGVPDQDAHYYAESIRRGDTLLVLRTDDERAQQAADIMRDNGALNVDRRFQGHQESGFQRFDATAQPYSTQQINEDRQRYASSQNTSAFAGSPGAGQSDYGQSTVASGGSTATNQSGNVESTTIPVVEEQANVGKRPVQTGVVRVYSHVTEQPVNEQVALRQENVTVDRRPVDRPATAQDLQAFQEGEIDITETAEEPVITKQARVVEEVAINKNTTETVQPVHTTVRRTDVEVENLDQEETLDEDANLTNRPVTNRQGL